MCVNTISAIWHWQQKEQGQLQLSETKINKENKVHDMWVCVFVYVYFCWRKHLQVFATTFPTFPKICLKTKTVKTQRDWSERNPREYLIQLSHFTDKKPEAQGCEMFCPQLCCFLVVEPELGRNMFILLPQHPLGETLMDFQWLE